MATTNLSAILDRPASQVERPKSIPIGTYLWVVKGLPRQDVSAKKKTPFYEFTVGCLQPGDDVDMDDLDAALTRKDGTKKVLTEVTQKLTFYLTDDALWRIKAFFEHCGLDVETDDPSVRQLAEQTGGCQFWGTIGHTASDDGESVFANIVKTAKVD